MLKHKSLEKDLVILLSGGMDSTLAYYYAIKEKNYKPEDIVCLWFDLGQPYNKKEEEALNSINIPYQKISMDLIRKEFNNIPTPDFPNQIIPGRNLIMATIAASFGKEIWMMALKGETHSYAMERDKSEKFFNDTSDLLSYIFNIKRGKTKVTSPFLDMTKSDIAIWAAKNNLEDIVLKTSTCYNEKYKNCGICSTCFKRWVATRNAGIIEEWYNNPWEGKDAKELINNYIKAYNEKDFSHYSKDRILDTFKALDLEGIKYG